MADESLAVELTGITKTFPGVIANEDVELAVGLGTIHAIVGENGAGKSTLMKILYGMQSPDAGTIRVRGREVTFRTPKDAIAEGIGMVHQHFMLADNLTVFENVVLGSEPTTGAWWRILFRFDGRISRGAWWFGVVASAVLAILTLLGSYALFLLVPIPVELASALALVATAGVALWMHVAVRVKRWHDLGKSGWWVLVGAIPLVGPIWETIACGFLKGSEESNDYGLEPTTGIGLDALAGREKIAEIGVAYGMKLDPDALVESLTVGERQRTEILKVLFRGARILILDEPTAVLVPQEVDELFANLRVMVEQGQTIIFISHHLDEVLAIADSITVMRGGRTVATVSPDDVDAKQLAELMVGSELPTPETTASTVTDVVELSIRDVSALSSDGRNVLSDVSFDIRRGEIVGIAGVEGNGQTELVDALMGIQDLSSGSIWFRGEDIVDRPTKQRRESGIGIIPADRHRQGLLLNSPLWENAMLGHQTMPPFAKGPWVNRKGARDLTVAVIDRFGVKTPTPDVSAVALSGGNQQKLIVGKEMIADPHILIAAHPTRGIDVGAQAAIWDELRAARADGLAVLLISADLEELIGLSDRLLVIYSGRIVADLDPQTVTPEQLGSYMTGVGVEVEEAS